MSCNLFPSESYDLFALGILDDAESEDLRRHLREDCGDCIYRVRESMEHVARLALTSPLVQPRAELRRRVVNLVKPAQSPRASWLRFAPAGFALAACGILAGLGLGRSVFHRDSSALPSAPGGPPLIISRLSPPPVPVVQLPVIAQPASPARQLPKEVAVVPDSDPGLAERRTQIASLEAALRAKDEQLQSARQQLSRLPVPSVPTPTVDTADYQERIERLHAEIQLYKTALERQRLELAQNTQLVSLLSVPDLSVINLAGTEQNAGTSGRALITARSGVFYATRLPVLQPGRSYQLWLMRRSAPAIVSGGVFRPDQANIATFTIKDATSLQGLTAMAVTEEPAGGSPLPTGHKILIGLAKS